jgi:diaminopimelate decarboxylase
MNLSNEVITGLASTYGNAFYLLDSDQFEKNYTNLTKAFSDIYPHFNIAYSYKTNYTPKLCQIINKYGGYAEVVSEMEMEIALRSGVSPKRIIWNGPIKNFNKAKELLLTGGTINVDEIIEMENIAKFVVNYPDHLFKIGIRCNFDVGDGVISRFGLDLDSEEFLKAIEIVKKTSNMRLINLQCHFAKRSVEYWPARAEGMLKVVNRVAKIIGYVPDRIDLGGGIYGNMHEDLKKQFSYPIPAYTDYANATATKFIEQFPDAKPELLIEPGSALAGDCMKFVGRVESIKKVKDKYFAAMLGSQKNISMSGVNPPMEIFKTGEHRAEYKNMDIVGYTCIEGDVMFKNYEGDLAVGDFLVFSNCGSYSVVMKPPFIMPNFPVLDICSGTVEVIKRSETFDDLFHTFAF